jgi:hypothetical protein
MKKAIVYDHVFKSVKNKSRKCTSKIWWSYKGQYDGEMLSPCGEKWSGLHFDQAHRPTKEEVDAEILKQVNAAKDINAMMGTTDEWPE